MSAETSPDTRPAEGHVVRRSVGLDGKRISYLAVEDVRAGTDETLLLIHGAGVSARSWTNQLQGLGRALHVLAIDLPGHGESDPIGEATVEGYADAARGLLMVLGAGRVFVAGHSLGGAVVQALAARHPGVVEGLVLLSTCAKLPGSDDSRGSFLWYLPGPLRKIVFFSMAKKAQFAPGAPRQAVLLGMEELRSCRPETIFEGRDGGAGHEPGGGGIRVPTLILCGSQDRLTPPELSERLKELIAGARLQIVEGAGHMLPLEAAERVNQETLDFVGAVSRRGIRRFIYVGGSVTKRSILRRLLDKARVLLSRE